MNWIQKMKLIVSGQRPVKDIWHYCLGNYRYRLMYSTNSLVHKLIRKHIQEQIIYRIEWMDKECLDNGSCSICGCETTALQMCDKPCEKPCYPAMMSRRQWESFKKGSTFKDKNGIWIRMLSQQGKPILLKEKTYNYVQSDKP